MILTPQKSHVLLVILITALSGCSTIPSDLGRSEVDALVAQRGQVAIHMDSEQATSELVMELMAQPLSTDSAVRIALVNSPRLKSAYARLGFAAADVYEAGRIRNPVFSGSLLITGTTGDSNQLTLGLAASFTDLITMSSRKRLSANSFAAMKQSIGAEVLQVAAEAEKAYYGYVGAQQFAALQNQIALSARLSADMATRYHAAGNISTLDLAMERAAASEARLEALHAASGTHAARAALAVVLGISSGASWSAPAQMQLPLTSEDDLNDLLMLARQSRLDLAAARTHAEVLADRLGVVNWTRWLGELDAGVETERETDGSRISGPTANWEIPIFTQHKGALLRAEADLKIAIAEVQRIATDVENSVRLAYADVENARARITEFKSVLIPQRMEATARAQEQVNFMLVSVFELLLTKQQEYSAYQGYLEAIRDYWLARADLGLAVGNALPGDAGLGDERIDIETLLQPDPAEPDHTNHGSKMMDHSSHKMPGVEKRIEPEHAEHDHMPMEAGGGNP